MQHQDKLKDVIPDDLILNILSFVEAADLTFFQATCERYRNLPGVDELWRKLCRQRWQTWPIYSLRVDISSEGGPGIPGSTWKERYVWVERDYLRTEIRIDELEGLEWYFNFLPWAGGSSDTAETMSSAYFCQGQLYLLKYLWMYPRLDYNIVEIPVVDNQDVSNEGDDILRNAEFLGGWEVVLGGPLSQAMIAAGDSSPRTSRKQYIQISTFRPHYVARTSVGGWILWNENVVFFSRGNLREVELPDQLEMHIHMFHF